ncbi:MAG: hypothetical protein LBL18_06180 [Bacteroidales bacterium]|jgi:hypothetical protein|nr:hypothetical protein [Bacteroidales bacterium]
MQKVIFILATILSITATTVCAQDNSGTITLNMFNAQHGNTCLDSWIRIDAHNNFTGASFISIEETDNPTVIPSTGWANKMAAEPGTTFIAYLKGVFYQIYVEDYIIHSNEKERTTGDWFSYTTTLERNTETLGVRISYRQLMNAKIARDTVTNNQNPRIFAEFGDNNVFTNKLKTKLTKQGCVITANAPQSDFQLYAKATERQFNSDRDFVYCYVGVTLELFNTLTGETVYVDDFSQKGVSNSHDRAVRTAVEDAVEAIGEAIMPLIIKNKEQ